jgi:hypothetical protein
MSDTGNSLIDIIEPATPAAVSSGSWLWFAGLGAVVLLLLVLLVLWWKYKLPAYRAQQRLRMLRHKWQGGEHTAQEAVLLLALELRHGLGVKRLLAEQAPPQCKPREQAGWTAFMRQLDAMLYQSGAERDAVQLAALFEQAGYWLRRYSRRSPYKKIGN